MDYAIAVEEWGGVGVRYGSAATYADLVRTWEDDREIPTEAELAEAYENYQPPLKVSVANLAFKEALIEAGILPDQVEAQLAAIPDAKLKAQATLRWQQSPIAINDPILQAQATAWGLTGDQLEAIYRRAMEIEEG